MNIQDFDYSVDLLQALLWQYNDAEVLEKIMDQKQTWYNTNQRFFWENWYTNVFNLLTADVFGLSVWSYILDIPLFIPLKPEDPDKPLFGFNEIPSINTYVNFNNGNFSTQNGVIILSIEEQRLVLRLKYYRLISRGAIPEINKFLDELFGSAQIPFQGNVWILDGFDMSIIYVFDFDIPLTMRQVLVEYDLLPRPAGVGIQYRVITDNIFGFNEIPSINVNNNFFNSNFYPSSFI